MKKTAMGIIYAPVFVLFYIFFLYENTNKHVLFQKTYSESFAVCLRIICMAAEDPKAATIIIIVVYQEGGRTH